MSLSTLPDLCLLTILDRIPLYDLLATVNRVCHRWETMRPIACHRRRQIVLAKGKNQLDTLLDEIPALFDEDILKEFINDDGTSYFSPVDKNYQLKYNTLIMTTQPCAQLVSTLPNIKSLQISQKVVSWSTQLNHLLHAWSNKLIHLNLFLYNDQQTNGFSPQLIDSLFNRINHLSSLKRLKLQFSVPQIHQNNHNLTTKLHILPQLEQFEYLHVPYPMLFAESSFDHFMLTNIEEALKAPNCSLEQVTLLSDPIARPHSSKLLSKLSSYFFVYKENDNFDDFCLKLSHFDVIQSLVLMNTIEYPIPFTRFIAHLSNLSRLSYLRLSKLCDSFFTTTPDFVPPPMPSMKAVEFDFATNLSHAQLGNLLLWHTFPNLRVAKLIQYTNKCTDCGYDLDGIEKDKINLPMVKICAEQSVKPLKKCTKLRKLFYCKNIHNSTLPRSLIEFTFTPDQL